MPEHFFTYLINYFYNLKLLFCFHFYLFLLFVARQTVKCQKSQTISAKKQNFGSHLLEEVMEWGTIFRPCSAAEN